MKRCPGFTLALVPVEDRSPGSPAGEENARLAAEGSASEWHLSPAHPHLFCGCGSETEDCHPDHCCQDDDWGGCANCGKPAPRALEAPVDESRFSDGLFEVPC